MTRTPLRETLRNILLVQDDTVHANAIRDALVNSSDGSFRVIWLRHCRDALTRLTDKNQQAPSIEHVAAVLVDLFLPDSTGIETFDRLFQAAPQIPILILTAAQNEDIAKIAVQ